MARLRFVYDPKGDRFMFFWGGWLGGRTEWYCLLRLGWEWGVGCLQVDK